MSGAAFGPGLTTTSAKRLTCYCLEMSEIKTMLLLKCLTAWLQIRKTLKRIPIENKLISPRQLVNFHSKRHEKVTYRKLAIHFGQCKSSRQKLAAKVVKTEPNWSNLFDSSTNQPLFRCVFCFAITVNTQFSSSSPDFNHVTFLARLHGISTRRAN